jgi:hypothetical protein
MKIIPNNVKFHMVFYDFWVWLGPLMSPRLNGIYEKENFQSSVNDSDVQCNHLSTEDCVAQSPGRASRLWPKVLHVPELDFLNI